jgi:hypothetical protein
VTGRGYIPEHADFQPEEEALTDSEDGKEDDGKQPPSTQTAAQRRKIEEVEAANARRKHAAEETVGSLQVADTAVTGAINTQDREPTRLLGDVLPDQTGEFALIY